MVPFLWRALTDERSFARLDVVGALLVAVSAAGFVLMVQSPSTGRAVLVAGIALAVVGLPLSAAWVRRHPHGFLPLSVIQNPIVLRNAFAGASVPAGWFALLVAVPAVLLADGWEPWQVGLLLVPSAVIALFVPRLTGPLMEAVGPTRSLAFAAVITTVALGVAALGSALVRPTLLAIAVILVTVGFGVGQPALSAAVADGVEPEVRGVALGVSTLVFLVGGSVGSAVVGGLGGVWGIGYGVLLLAVLPVAALGALAPELVGRREREPAGASLR